MVVVKNVVKFVEILKILDDSLSAFWNNLNNLLIDFLRKKKG